SPFDLDFLRSPRVPGGFWRFPEMRFQKCLSVRGPPESSSCSSSCSSFSNGGASSSSFSVMGIYIGVVYTIGRFLRMVFQDSSKRMIYEELPDTARLTDLCNGIYTARITGDLYREHEFYYELVRIYRSPELLLEISGKWGNRGGAAGALPVQ
ncbi:unnamed protein product, partial [Prorocentrum cordatum]